VHSHVSMWTITVEKPTPVIIEYWWDEDAQHGEGFGCFKACLRDDRRFWATGATKEAAAKRCWELLKADGYTGGYVLVPRKFRKPRS